MTFYACHLCAYRFAHFLTADSPDPPVRAVVTKTLTTQKLLNLGFELLISLIVVFLLPLIHCILCYCGTFQLGIQVLRF